MLPYNELEIHMRGLEIILEIHMWPQNQKKKKLIWIVLIHSYMNLHMCLPVINTWISWKNIKLLELSDYPDGF